MAERRLNDQIADSVAFDQLFTIGQASAQSLAIVEAVGSETIGASMHNAVRSQQNAQTISSAAVTAACAKILQANHQPPPLEPDPPPTEAGGADKPSAPGGLVGIARDAAAARTAIAHLVSDAKQSSEHLDEASMALDEMRRAATLDSPGGVTPPGRASTGDTGTTIAQDDDLTPDISADGDPPGDTPT